MLCSWDGKRVHIIRVQRSVGSKDKEWKQTDGWTLPIAVPSLLTRSPVEVPRWGWGTGPQIVAMPSKFSRTLDTLWSIDSKEN